MELCYCGSNLEFSKCCGPYLDGKQNPKTAESLMRSRYSAFCTGNIDYIINTHHKSTRDELDRAGVESWALGSEWISLKIHNTEKGGENDSTGVVEFSCLFNFDGKNQNHHEVSTFKKEDGKWYFVDGVLKDTTFKREAPKVGRNDPCPCGSGKKYKKCCG